MTNAETDAITVLADVGRHPIQYFLSNWNWKTSAFSALSRAAMFYGLNAPAGPGLAVRAAATELIFRAVASGALGSLTQALRHSRPRITALVLLPAIGHLLEYAVHQQAGTPRLGASIAASIAFSVVTTAFNLFAMRRGVLIVGPGQQPFLSDVARLPRLCLAFAASGLPGRRRPRRQDLSDKEQCL